MTKGRESATSARKIIALRRQQQGLQLRLAGMTYQAIGDQLGITKKGAEKSIKAAMQAYRVDIAEQTESLRAQAMARLAALRKAHWAAAVSGKDLDAAEFVRKLEERETRLLGLDVQPQRLFGGGAGDPSAAPQTVSITGGLPSRTPTPQELAPLPEEVPTPGDH